MGIVIVVGTMDKDKRDANWNVIILHPMLIAISIVVMVNLAGVLVVGWGV